MSVVIYKPITDNVKDTFKNLGYGINRALTIHRYHGNIS